MKPVDFYLIRGLGRESAHWGEFKAKLEAQDFVGQVTCLDLPGSGVYNKISSPLTIGEYAEFLLTQIPKNDNDKAILSISMGSMVAIELVKRASYNFRKLYVMNSSFANLSPIQHRLQLHAIKQIGKMIFMHDMEHRELQVLKMISNDSTKWNELGKAWAKIATERPVSLPNFLKQLLAAGTYRVDKNPPPCPTVVICSEGDRMVDCSCSRKLAQHWNLPIYANSSAGHDIPIDDPEWLIKTIRDTL